MLVTVSRLLNTLTGGRPDELLCARAHRRNWRLFCKVVDAAFFVLRGEAQHCAQRWSEHHAEVQGQGRKEEVT